MLTDADYEYMHYAPDFSTAGGAQVDFDARNTVVKADTRQSAANPALGELNS